MALKDDIRKLVESKKTELTREDREAPVTHATTAAKLEDLRPFLKDFEEVGASCYVSEGGLFAQVDIAGLYVTIHPPGKSLGIQYSGWYVTAIQHRHFRSGGGDDVAPIRAHNGGNRGNRYLRWFCHLKNCTGHGRHVPFRTGRKGPAGAAFHDKD